MGTEFFDLDALLGGFDPNDPIGLDKYLEEERKKKEELNDTFLGALTRPIRETPHDVSSLGEAFIRAAGLPFELAQAPIDYLASKPPQIIPGVNLLQQEHVKPASQLLRSAIAPEVLPGDVSPISHHVTMTPQGPIETTSPTTSQDIENSHILSNIIGKGVEEVGNFGLNPANAAMGLEGLGGKAMSMAFLPGMAQSFGEQIGKGISDIESDKPAEAAESFTGGLINALMLGGVGSHLARREPRPGTSEVKQSEEVNIDPQGMPIDRRDTTSLPGKPFALTVPLKARSVGRLRFDNMVTEALKRLDPLVEEVFPGFNEQGKLSYDPSRDPGYGVYGKAIHPDVAKSWETPGIRLSMESLLHTGALSKFAKEVADTLVHERFAHALGSLHGQYKIQPGGNKTYNVGDEVTVGKTTIPSLEVTVPKTEAWDTQGVGKYGNPEDFSANMQENIAFHNPKILEIRDQIERNIINNPDMVKDLVADWKKGPGVLDSDLVKTYAEDVDPQGNPIKEGEAPTESSDILHTLLRELKLTKFNKATIASEFEKQGVPLPDEMKSQLPALIEDLKSRGLINEKAAGTYTVNTGSPKKFSDQATKEAQAEGQTDLEKALNASIENLPKGPIEVPSKSVAEAKKPIETEQTQTIDEWEPGKVETKPSSEAVTEGVLTEQQIKAQELADARKRMEEQLAREEGRRQRDEQLNKLEIDRRNAMLKGDVATANNLKNQIMELRNAPLPTVTTLKPEGKPKSLEQEMKENLTPAELKAISEVFSTSKGAGKDKVPEEVRLAQEAASQVRNKTKGEPKKKAEERVQKVVQQVTKSEPVKETSPSQPVQAPKTKDEKVVEEMKSNPPQPPTEQPKGKDRPRNWKVTLSDGSEHIVRASDVEQVHHDVNAILSQHNSSKTIDKVEPHLSTLERAAIHEIDPVEQGSQTIRETIKDTRKAISEEVSEGKKLRNQELKLEAAQKREKFAKKIFNVVLSNGEKVTHRARNAEVAKADIEAQIKSKGSGVKIASIAEAKSPLERAIEGTPPEPKKEIKKGPWDDATDIPKTLKSAFDLSWPGRQGLYLLNRPQALKGMYEGSKGILPFKGEEFHKRTIEDLTNRPNAKLYDRFGLNQVKWEPGDIASRSEQFASEKVSALPGFRHSEHAFNDAGNLARANMFDHFDSLFRQEGKSPDTHPELYKGMADYLNVLTMRKPLPQVMKKAGWILNKMFFSPMAVYSRLQMVNPGWYAKLPREMQKAALRDIGGTLGTITALLGGIKMAANMNGISPDDVDVSFDPTHTHFMRLKIKETYYDMPGLTPLIRTAARLATAIKTTPKDKYILPGGMLESYQRENTDLEDAPFGQNAWLEGLGFFENKTSPMYQFTKGMLSKKDYYGNDYGFSSAVADLFGPISATQMVQTGMQYGPEAAARQLPDFFGVGAFSPGKGSKTVAGSSRHRRRRRGSSGSSDIPSWMK